MNGGIFREVEYVDEEGKRINKTKLEEMYRKEIFDEFPNKEDPCSTISILKEDMEDYASFFDSHSKSTKRTSKQIDCGSMNAREVYIKLVHKADITAKELLIISDTDIFMSERIHGLTTYNTFSTSSIVPEGLLFKCKGLLFVDNLYCHPENSEDDVWYRNLACIIKERLPVGYIPNMPNVDWLFIHIIQKFFQSISGSNLLKSHLITKLDLQKEKLK